MYEVGEVFCSAEDIRRMDNTPRNRPNHGRPWAPSHFTTMHELYNKGISLMLMADILGRLGNAVVIKLHEAHMIVYDSVRGVYFCNKPSKSSEPVEIKEPEMSVEQTNQSVKNIETVVMIQGKDAATMTDEQIFTFIRALEDKVANYRLIKNQPKKLLAKISELSDDIQALVSYVDGR